MAGSLHSVSKPARRGLTLILPIASEPTREQADAVIDALSRRQIDQVFGGSEAPAEDLLAQRSQAWRDAKRGVGGEGFAAERAEASEISNRIVWAMGPVMRIAEVGFMIVGWTWLGSGLLAAVLAFLSGGAPSDDTESWTFAGIAGLAFLVSAITFPLAGLGLVLRNWLVGVRKRRIREALLDWAVERPGQLARGLPGWGTDASAAGLTPAASVVLNLLKWAFGIGGIFFGPIGVVVLLLGLAFQERASLEIGGLLTGGGLVLLGLAWLIRYLMQRMQQKDALLDAGLHWVWAGRRPRDQHSSSGEQVADDDGAAEATPPPSE